jgi:vacuolar protein-sorting-associated protein 4
MINDALMAPVRKLDKVRLWKEVNDGGQAKYSPCYENHQRDPTAKYFEGTMDQVKTKGYNLLLLTTYEDFLTAMKSSKPSVSQSDLQKYIDWTKSFGVEG